MTEPPLQRAPTPHMQPTGDPSRVVIIPGMAIYLPPRTVADEIVRLGQTIREHPGLKRTGAAFIAEADAWAELFRDFPPEVKETLRAWGIEVPA